MKYIDCKGHAAKILSAVQEIPNKKKLIIITAGDDPASKSYVKGKIRDCEFCGIPYDHIIMPEESDQNDLGMEILRNNMDPEVAGIIVQLPLPVRYNESYLTNRVHSTKDVDGFKSDSPFSPCTPEGIVHILKEEIGDLSGKHALIIGRGKLVGEPLAKMLLNEDCTITIAHSKTKGLNKLLSRAEIIVSAVGKEGIVDLKCCRSAEIVIDAGVNRNKEGKLCGDCYNFDPEFLENLKVTKVPGGVGLLTRAMLMKHVGDASCM